MLHYQLPGSLSQENSAPKPNNFVEHNADLNPSQPPPHTSKAVEPE